MRLVIRSFPDTYELLTEGEPTGEGSVRRFADRGAALRFLTRLYREPLARAMLARLHREYCGAVPATGRRFLEQLSWRVAAGAIRILRRPPAGVALTPIEKVEPQEPEVAERPVNDDEEPAYDIWLRLVIDPNEASSVDDTFTLFGGKSKDAREYEQTKTTSDDLVEGDDCVDLLFEDLVPYVNYWLRVDPGEEGEEYYAFENWPWGKVEGLAIEK